MSVTDIFWLLASQSSRLDVHDIFVSMAAAAAAAGSDYIQWREKRGRDSELRATN